MYYMKMAFLCVCLLTYILLGCASATNDGFGDKVKLFQADNPLFQYVGRIDFSDAKKPRFWSPGVYITAKFTGGECELLMNDQELWDKNHNYLEIKIDDQQPFKIQTTQKQNVIKVASGLSEGEHTIVICKNTESNIGYLEFVGLRCKALLPLPAKPVRKIEFIGNSITCGTGSDQSSVPCGGGVWQDQHNAYLSYGPVIARQLNAQWSLSAVSGIGLIHSCCRLTITMPRVFDKIDLRGDSLQWDFANYQPDVVTICLGQNDGLQDSVVFCNAYIKYIQQLRGYYPSAQFILLTSPMADEALTAMLKSYLTGIKKRLQATDKKVATYFYTKRYYNGCDGHPDLAEHQQIAKELGTYIKTIMIW